MKCTCKQCGKTFELSDSEIDFYKKKNLNLPRRCKECRQANKQKQDKPSYGADDWSADNQYSKVSRQQDNKIGKWMYVVMAVSILLIVLVITVPNMLFGQSDIGTAGIVENQADSDIVKPIRNNSYSSSEADNNTDGDLAEIPQSNPTDVIEPESDKQADFSEPAQSKPTGNIEPVQTEDAASAETDLNAPEPQETIQSSPVTVYTFRNQDLLAEHYQKHGIEMEFASAEEYQAAASAVVNNENSLHKFEAEDGDDVYYLEATNDFVIVSTDGYIRTYFRPDSGKAYYDKQ